MLHRLLLAIRLGIGLQGGSIRTLRDKALSAS